MRFQSTNVHKISFTVSHDQTLAVTTPFALSAFVSATLTINLFTSSTSGLSTTTTFFSPLQQALKLLWKDVFLEVEGRRGAERGGDCFGEFGWMGGGEDYLDGLWLGCGLGGYDGSGGKPDCCVWVDNVGG